MGEHTGLPLWRFGLEQTGEAHDLVESGVVGKVLIDVVTETVPVTPSGSPGNVIVPELNCATNPPRSKSSRAPR